MPLNNLLCGLLETGLNKLQQLDTSAQQRRKILDGTVIGVTLKELNKPLYFIISKQQIDLLSQFDGQTDCFIRLNISALKELQNNHQLTYLIKSEQLEVDGDIQVAQQFAQLITEMDIDWEEHLSSIVGDVVAHKFCYHSKQAKHKLSSSIKKMEQQTGLYLTEEIKLAPNGLEVAHFCDQVTALSKHCNAVEERLNNLLNR